MRNKIQLTRDSGEVVEVELINSFTVKNSGNNYMMYTINEIDSSNLIKIYVSKVFGNTEPFALIKIEDEAEWTGIKDIMRGIIATGALDNIQYNNLNLAGSKLEDSKIILLPVDAVNNALTNSFYNKESLSPVVAATEPIVPQEAVSVASNVVSSEPVVSPISIAPVSEPIQTSPVEIAPEPSVISAPLTNPEPPKEVSTSTVPETSKFLTDIQDIIKTETQVFTNLGNALIQRFAEEVKILAAERAAFEAEKAEFAKDKAAQTNIIAQGKEMLEQAKVELVGNQPAAPSVLNQGPAPATGGPNLTLVNPEVPKVNPEPENNINIAA